MNFLGIFRAQNDCLVIGYLMGAEIFEFRPNFGLWQLFKEGNRQGILLIFSNHHNFGLDTVTELRQNLDEMNRVKSKDHKKYEWAATVCGVRIKL